MAWTKIAKKRVCRENVLFWLVCSQNGHLSCQRRRFVCCFKTNLFVRAQFASAARRCFAVCQMAATAGSSDLTQNGQAKAIVKTLIMIVRLQKWFCAPKTPLLNCASTSTAGATFDFVPAVQVSLDRYLIYKDGAGVLTNAKFKSFHLEIVCQRVVKKNLRAYSGDVRCALALLLQSMAKMGGKYEFRVPGIRGLCVTLSDDVNVGLPRNVWKALPRWLKKKISKSGQQCLLCDCNDEVTYELKFSRENTM